MNSPQLSPEDKARAEHIFKRNSYNVGASMGVLFLGLYAAWSRTFHPLDFVGRVVWCCGLLSVYWLSCQYAIGQVRRAGLSQEREERRIIDKEATSFEGVCSIIRDRKIISERGFYTIFPLSLTTFFLLFQISGLFTAWRDADDHFFVALILAIVSAVAYNNLMRNPIVLRLDERGLWSATASLWPRGVSWAQVADLQEIRRWNFRDEPQPVSLHFRDATGRTVLRVAVSSKNADSVVAHIEAIFKGNGKISEA